MIETIAPALASAGASVAGNIIQNHQQNARDAAARRFQIDMFNRSNAYNSPSAVMARMKQAGLNPNLMTGLAPSPAASVPSASSGSRSASFDDVAPNLISALSASQQIKSQQLADRLSEEKTHAEIENINADTAEKQARTPVYGVDSDIKLSQEQRAKELFEHQKSFWPFALQDAENKSHIISNESKISDNNLSQSNFDHDNMFERYQLEIEAKLDAHMESVCRQLAAEDAHSRHVREMQILQQKLNITKQEATEIKLRVARLKILHDEGTLLRGERAEYLKKVYDKELSDYHAYIESIKASRLRNRYTKEPYHEGTRRQSSRYGLTDRETELDALIFGHTPWENIKNLSE